MQAISPSMKASKQASKQSIKQEAENKRKDDKQAAAIRPQQRNATISWLLRFAPNSHENLRVPASCLLSN